MEIVSKGLIGKLRRGSLHINGDSRVGVRRDSFHAPTVHSTLIIIRSLCVIFQYTVSAIELIKPVMHTPSPCPSKMPRVKNQLYITNSSFTPEPSTSLRP
jgi:hypothetical protein